jgi:hypothetical protein
MEHQVRLVKTVTVHADSLLEAVRRAESQETGAKAAHVYCDETGDSNDIVDRCEGCDKPILDNDGGGAFYEDGVRTCGECDPEVQKPTLTLVK